MPAQVHRARCQVQDQHVARQLRLQGHGVDQRHLRHRRQRRTPFPRHSGQPRGRFLQHPHVPVHLRQPGGGHVGAPPTSSHSTMRAPRTGAKTSVSCTSWPPGACGIRRMPPRTRRRADVEAVRGPAVSASSARTPRRSSRVRRRDRRRLAPHDPPPPPALAMHGCAPGLAVLERQAGQRPADGAVAKGRHPVGNAGVHQRLRADDAARAPGAVHDDQRLGRRRGRADAQTSSAPGTLMPRRHAHRPVSSSRRASSTTRSAPSSISRLQFACGKRGV